MGSDTLKVITARTASLSLYPGLDALSYPFARHQLWMYIERTKELKWYLVDQGHDGMEVQRYIDHTTNVKKAKALKRSEKNTFESRVSLVVTHHPCLQKLSVIVNSSSPPFHPTCFRKDEADNTEPPPGGMQTPKKPRRSLVRCHTKAATTNLRGHLPMWKTSLQDLHTY